MISVVGSRVVLRRCLALSAMILAGVFTNGVHAQGSQDYLVQFREGTSAAGRIAATREADAGLRIVYARLRAVSVRVPNAAALAALRRNPDVVAVVPNRPLSAYQRANGKPGGGSGQPQQIVPEGIKRVGAHTPFSDGSGVGVAILDTGIDLNHPDLAVSSQSVTAYGTSCQDDEGHGTHVSGTVAARNNDRDVVGVAPSAVLYCAKVLDFAGNGTDETLLTGLDWVLEHHASLTPPIKVVNMSLGRPRALEDSDPLNPMRVALETLAGEGVLVVAAAGNSPSMDVANQIPASHPGVVSVASTTAVDGSNQCRLLSTPIRGDTASYFTADGPTVTVSAPGEDREDVSRGCLIRSIGILSTKLGGGTARMSGTSMASPHVAGIAARYFQLNPGATAADVRGWIAVDASLKGTVPFDSPTTSYTFDGHREGVAQAPGQAGF